MGKRTKPDVDHFDLDGDVQFGPVLQESVAIADQPLTARPTFADALPLEQIIDSSPVQTRADFNPQASEEDAELAASIAKNGVVVPVLVVRAAEERYRLAAGHRRVAASRHVSKQSVRALIFAEGTSQEELDQFTFLENFHRKELSPMETARQVEYMQSEYGWKQTDAADALSISQTMVSQLLKLLQADIELQTLVDEDKVGMRYARNLMKLKADERKKSYELIATGVPVTDVLNSASQGAFAGDKASARSGKRKQTGSSKGNRKKQTNKPMEVFLEEVLSLEGVGELKKSLGRKGAFKELSDHDQAVVALLGHYRNRDWQKGLDEYYKFTLPNRRVLAMIVKQLSRLQLLRDAQRDKAQGLLALQLLAHSAQVLAGKEISR
ncbi:MAG: ParB/RepB/Spo0J family partition protein [Chloroflexi bacterium]|nr:MAG: ParB/RepB/Spo0J family partition protein [Chloroflexota bacterium]MBL1195190.1 ParB/RepB/Spo0J family partition protein [Chloroflexota bacterium]NOH12475.1 ParB/RepB/Spo0J family partition protein [Chloroflexota bacterium]